MKRVLLTCAALLALTLSAQIRETMTVNLVEVPVTVVDGNGDPLRGLTAANFELYDNGTKRPITAFDKIDFAASESLEALSPLNPAARRQFLLLFDLSNSGPKALGRAQEAARRFLAENVQPRDLVGVGTIDSERGFRLLTALTTDRKLTEEAMRDPRAFKGSDPLQIAANPETFRVDKPTVALDTDAQRREIAANEELSETARRGEKLNEGATRQHIERSVDALGQLANLLRAVPGRKQVVLLTEGFDPKYLQGRDVRATEDTNRDNDAVAHGQVWTVDNDARFGNTASMNLVDRMARYFRQSDVVLNAIDIQGVRVQNDIEHGATINSNDGLFLLSRPTGGEVFENVNDLKSDFQKMLHQQEVVYVLGFQAPPQKPGSFHNLKVKLVDVPNARASYRAGYFESGSETPQERILTNAEIIVNDIPETDVHLDEIAAAFPDGPGDAQVPVLLEMNGPDLLKDVRGNAAHVEIYIYAFDDAGVVRNRLYQNLTLDLRKVGQKLRETGIKYYGTLSLPPGRYAIKSLVRSLDNERRGYSRTDIVVPKPGDVAALQPVPMDDQWQQWVMVKGNTNAAKAPYPFVLNGQDFFPAAAIRNNGQPQKIALFVFGTPTQELTWQTNPPSKFLGRADSLGQAALVLEVDPASAKDGAIDITVHKNGVAEARKVSVRVESAPEPRDHQPRM